MSISELSREAAREALRLRARAKIALDQSFCVIDLAASLGIEVMFVNLTSFEGAYIKSSQKVLLSAHRPDGRTRFTCGHELGHHAFNHGDHFDELVEKVGTEEARNGELICDLFSAFLIMPSSLVKHGFHIRKIIPPSLTPLDILRVSSWLGVGYETLVNHLHLGIRIISKDVHNSLLKAKLTKTKEELLGTKTPNDVFYIDEFWKGRPVDMSIGDYIVSKDNIKCDCNNLQITKHKDHFVAKALKTGIIHFQSNGTGYLGRIKRSEYTGRALFRHLDED